MAGGESARASRRYPRGSGCRHHRPAIATVAAEPAEAAHAGPTPARPEEFRERAGDAAALEPRFTFDSFVVGKPNEFAYACARRVAEQPACAGFNPLFLYGGVGLGKTHLMHAIAWELGATGRGAARPSGQRRLHVGGTVHVPLHRRDSQPATMEFKEQLRSVDVLMIDDLQFLIGKDATQEEFFHTFNALVEAGKQIVVSADKSPSDLSGLEERVRTRLGGGMVADLHATTFELRVSILETKATRAGVDVPPRCWSSSPTSITSNVRELEGALNRLIAHANLFGRPITLETAQEVLHDVLQRARPAHQHRGNPAAGRRALEHPADRHGLAAAGAAVARPRQVAMFLAKQLTSRSLPEIGKKFGNRDHTTVMHAVQAGRRS